MRIIRIVTISLVVYVGIVVAFESGIGALQPKQAGSTLVITTFDASGAAHDRVVSKLESDGKLYVAANHWPRAWYRRALASPDVEATLDGGTKGRYRAVPITGAELDRVSAEHPLPAFFRLLTGFPPRLLMRLDPR
jgi:hypothetical protein